MKLRLILTEKCNRNCEGCCNKDFDIKNLPIEEDFTKYSKIFRTSGEPMLYPEKIIRAILIIKEQNPTAKIFLYTAHVSPLYTALTILKYLDGITVTLHEQSDLDSFQRFDSLVALEGYKETKSLRLNIFKGINLNNFIPDKWKIKNEIEWIKNSPLPPNEVLKKAHNNL